jgi:uncharacterized membrane protein YczE
MNAQKKESYFDRLTAKFRVKNFWKKFLFVAVAIFLMGFNLSLLIVAGWGTDPCSFMNLNLASKIGWTLGNWQLTLNAAMLLFTLAFGPELIGAGTVLNMVLIGYTADFFCWIWLKTGLTAAVLSPDLFPLRILVFAVAICFFVVAAAVYMNCDMGLSPYDAAIKIISGWVSRIPYFAIRIAYDLLAVGIGLAAGLSSDRGIQGSMIGSVIMALAIGPAITAAGKFMKRHVSVFRD